MRDAYSVNWGRPTMVRPKEKKVTMSIQKTIRLMIVEGWAFTPPLSRKVTIPSPVRPLVETEEYEELLDELPDQPAYYEAGDHDAEHDKNIPEDVGEVLPKVEHHVAEKGFHGKHLIGIVLCLSMGKQRSARGPEWRWETAGKARWEMEDRSISLTSGRPLH